jgi:hypothetical protein
LAIRVTQCEEEIAALKDQHKATETALSYAVTLLGRYVEVRTSQETVRGMLTALRWDPEHRIVLAVLDDEVTVSAASMRFHVEEVKFAQYDYLPWSQKGDLRQ